MLQSISENAVCTIVMFQVMIWVTYLKESMSITFVT